MSNITNIPAPRVAFIDPRTGLMAREWYRFFVNLFTLTGSGESDTSITDLAVSPYADAQAQLPNLGPETQLASLMARYDDAQAAIQGAYLPPAAIPDTQQDDPTAFGAPRPELGTIAVQDAENLRVGNLTATGTVSFGTTAAITTETVTDYVTINDSGGTPIKLAVVS